MNRTLTNGAFAVAVLCLSLGAQTFSNATTGSGLNVPTSTWVFRGAAWADFNNDGLVDLFAPGNDTNEITMYYNLGGGQFFGTAVLAAGSGGARRDNYCIAGDIDNDGDEDVFLCQGNNTGSLIPNKLYINDGSGIFSEQAALRGVGLAANTFAASFGDYDRDGWLDLVIGIYGQGAQNSALNTGYYVLYRNTGNGNFVNTTVAAGLSTISANVYAVLFADYDRDQWPDIWCIHDLGTVGGGLPTRLLRNNRNGTFTNVATTANAAAAIDGMCATVADVQNDGDWDVFISNIAQGHCLLLQNANSVFTAGAQWWTVAQSNAIQTNGGTGWASKFIDYDNDARQDLAIMQNPGLCQIYRGNSATPLFTAQSTQTAFSTVVPSGWGGGSVDYDNDGAIDWYASGGATTGVLVRNSGLPTNNWIKLNLVGTNSNRSAIGAVAIVRTPGVVQRRMVLSGEGYLVDGDKRLHFGLGTATTINEIEVRWPSGSVQYISTPTVNQVLTITEPTIGFVGAMNPGSVNQINLTFPSDVGLQYVGALCLNVASEYYLPDTRALRVDVNDPIIVQTTTFGNPVLGFYTGLLPIGGGASMTFAIPAIPFLTGLGAYTVGVTISASYPGSVKSILGPQRFVIQ